MAHAPLDLSLPMNARPLVWAKTSPRPFAPATCCAVKGDLGAGKTTLARALIRALADDALLDVPSPTFTLVQSYDTRVPVHHFDLYRLTAPEDSTSSASRRACQPGAVTLVEWPERTAGCLPMPSV